MQRAEGHQLERLPLLLVDDEPLAAQALGRVLEQQFAITTADDPRSALALVGQWEFAVVVARRRMAVLGGLELVALLQRGYPALQAVIVGDRSDAALLQGGDGRPGRIAVLVEPWQADEALALVGVAAAEYRARSQQAGLGAETRRRQQAVLAQLGRQALEGEDLQPLLAEATEMVASVLDVELAKVLELLPGGQELLLRAGVGWQDGLVGRVTVPVAQQFQAGYTLLAGGPVIAEDLAREVRFGPPPLLVQHGVVSGLSVRIEGPAGPAGVLGAHTSRRRSFSADDADFLQSVANILGTAFERRRAEAERERLLREVERERRLLAAVVRQMVAGLIVAEAPSGKLILGNEQAELIWRHPLLPSETTGDYGDWKGFHRDGRPYQAGEWPLARSLRSGEVVADEEIEIERGDGSRGMILVSSAPVRDEQGVVIAAVATFFDVTEREHLKVERSAALAQAAAEAHFRALVEAAPDALLAVGPDGRITIANTEAERLFGYTREELAGMVVEDLVPERLRAAHERHRAAYAVEPRTREMGVGLDLRARRKDGSELPVEIRLSPVSTEHGPLVVAVVRNVAERRRLEAERERLLETEQVTRRAAEAAEARFRTLFEETADAVLVAHPAGRYLDANRAAITLLGYGVDELRSMPLASLMPDAVLLETRTSLEQQGRWEGELELRRKDGSLVPVEAHAVRVSLPTGPAYLVTLRDISERKALERLQQEFLAMVTHDLRNPLAAIRGFAQLQLRRGIYDPSTSEVILRQADHLNRMVNDLLDVARLEAGRLELQRERVDLVELARRAVAQAQAQSSAHQVRLQSPDQPLEGRWDPGRLEQVLANLLSNAIKYSPEGGEVLVRVEALGDQARLSVTDQGVGVPSSALRYLFQRFGRTAEAKQSGIQGIGLGLYIVKSLVEAHGGRVEVESEPGRGSTFRVLLPLRTPLATP